MNTSKLKTPFVSIVIPCYNEEKHIALCLQSILDNNYPINSFEILLMDGISTDKTREIIQSFQEKYNNIILEDNPGRNKPRALNLGIQKARGEVVMRMDAHAVYDKQYISKCVDYLFRYNVDNVGGIRKTLPGTNTIIAKSIAYSLSSKFAVGNATYRAGTKQPILTDIVFLFCCRKKLFEQVGFFDERLVRGQDREFNLRLKKYGCRMLLAPDIISYYYARNSLKSFTHWIIVGGMTPAMISRIVGRPLFSYRNFVPSIFLTVTLLLLIGGVFDPFFSTLLILVILLYLAVSLFFAYEIFRKERKIIYLLSMPLIFLITHYGYGLGLLIGFFVTLENDPCI